MKPQRPLPSLFQRFFWLIASLTVISYVLLFRVVGPDASPVHMLTLSIVALVLTIASIVVVIRYLVTRKPSQLTKVAGVVVIIGLLFGIFLNSWYIVNAVSRLG